ncbi:MAG: vWA domain-containing protein [Hyphomicrobiaceae bacterium]
MQNSLRHIRALIPVLAAIACLLHAGAGQAHAQAAPTVMLIFDGSGSMWGKLDGERQSKLAMARRAVEQSFSILPPQTRFGLASYGFRRSGDCSDAAVILKPDRLDAERIMSPLDKLNPRGRGPMTAALQGVAEDLGPPSAPATIIVVHDGLDNCQQDPCSAIAGLKAAHPGVKINVISLGLPPEEAQQVSCLANRTGGRQFIVNTAAETTAAMREAMQLASLQPTPGKDARTASGTPLPRQPRTTVIPKGGPGLQLIAKLAKTGAPLDAPLNWRVFAANGKGAPLWQGKAIAPLLDLPTGRYTVEVSSGLITRRFHVDAASGEARRVELNLDAGTLVLAEPGTDRRVLEDTMLSFTPIGEKGLGEPKLIEDPDAEIVLPAGNYLVAMTSQSLRIERPIGIAAGSRISLANSLALGSVELSSVARKGGAPLDSVVYAIYEDDPDAPQGRTEVARSAAPHPRFKLPSGTYFVIARRGAVEIRDRIIVRPGAFEKRQLVLDSSELAVAVNVAGGLMTGRGPISVNLVRQGTPPAQREVLSASGANVTFETSAGSYQLDTHVGLGNVRSTRDITLRPGEQDRVSINFPAGAVSLRLLDKAKTLPIPDVSWEILDRDGKSVWVGVATRADALLLAGRYQVKAEGRGQKVERQIDVRSGEALAYELSLR